MITLKGLPCRRRQAMLGVPWPGDTIEDEVQGNQWTESHGWGLPRRPVYVM